MGRASVSILIAASAVFLAAPAAAQSGVATSSIDVSLVVEPACNVTAAPLSFRGTAGRTIDAEAGIAVTCNGETAVAVRIDGGTNALGSERRLRGERDHVSYAVYSDPARGQRWDAGRAITGVARDGLLYLTAYGRVEQGATLAAAGTYSDTIAVTVEF
jgi:spore coat protein U-like protein